MKILLHADHSMFGGVLPPVRKGLQVIMVELVEKKLTVNGHPAEMLFTGAQLRFTVSNGGQHLYVVQDDRGKGRKRFRPPQPIAELYQLLTEPVSELEPA